MHNRPDPYKPCITIPFFSDGMHLFGIVFNFKRFEEKGDGHGCGHSLPVRWKIITPVQTVHAGKLDLDFTDPN
jgi:hypothetical protein